MEHQNPNGESVKTFSGKNITAKYHGAITYWDHVICSCYHAIIRAVIPLIEEPEAQIDKQVVNPLFDRLRPATLEILQKIKLNNSDTNWLRKGRWWMSIAVLIRAAYHLSLASDVLLLLFSVRVQDAVNFQWSIYQYICSQISPDEIVDISICQAILVKFVKVRLARTYRWHIS